MADILVTSPFQPFTLPTQFKAVFNGYIYCGTVDAVDPSVSQVQVYLVNESGDKVPVAQPLRTNAGGYLVYNGQPAKFVTDSNHSLLVQDSFHLQVWYAPDVSKVDPSTIATILGAQIREALRRSYAEAGYILVAGSFEAGGVLTSEKDVLLYEASGHAYAGAGPFPQTVAAGTDPNSSGFIDKSSAIRIPVTYAGIRSYSGQSKELHCVGRATVFDRGAGDFFLDDADTTSLDNDGTVIVDALNRRWKRRFSGSADVRWWGVLGDGSSSDSVALAKAIASSTVLKAWDSARILLTKTFDDATPPSQQYTSYAIKPTTSCTLDLAGGTIVRAAIGSGDNIDMYHSIIVDAAVKFRIENGAIDMNNHNGRFAAFTLALPDSGIYNCEFINTRNNGTPRTTLPDSSGLVLIRNCNQVYVDDCKFFIGVNGDLSGNASPSYDNPSFGVRIATKFVTNEADQNESTVSCAVRRCEFWGPFTWQPIEIAGSGTRSCYAKHILMFRPLLSMIDLDKGCKRCYFKDIEIRFPQPGIPGTSGGGDGFEVIRFQGYWIGSDIVYAEDCWAANIDIYGPPYALGTSSSSMLGNLISSANALRCKVRDVMVHGVGLFRTLVSADSTSDLLVERVSAHVAVLTYATAPWFTLNDCNIKLSETGFIVSPVYMFGNGASVKISKGSYTYTGAATPSFATGFEQTSGQPTIEVFGVNTFGFNSFGKMTGTTQLTKVRFAGNVSKQKVADVWNTVPAANLAGNVSVIF